LRLAAGQPADPDSNARRAGGRHSRRSVVENDMF
jgi:hypothetical protein